MNLSMLIRESQYASDVFPRYYNLVDAGLVYGVTYAAAAPTAASATATGSFALFNPAASGVQLVLLGMTIPIITDTAGATGAGFGFQLVSGQQPTTTTPGNVPQNMLVGNAGVSQAKTYTAGTLVGAPTVPGYYSVGVLQSATGGLVMLKDDIAGAVVVNPNSGIDVVFSGTFVVTIAPSLLWAEVPLG